jgi:hypothetical protein
VFRHHIYTTLEICSFFCLVDFLFAVNVGSQTVKLRDHTPVSSLHYSEAWRQYCVKFIIDMFDWQWYSLCWQHIITALPCVCQSILTQWLREKIWCVVCVHGSCLLLQHGRCMRVLTSIMQKYSTYSARCFVSIKTIKTLPNLIEVIFWNKWSPYWIQQ